MNPIKCWQAAELPNFERRIDTAMPIASISASGELAIYFVYDINYIHIPVSPRNLPNVWASFLPAFKDRTRRESRRLEKNNSERRNAHATAGLLTLDWDFSYIIIWACEAIDTVTSLRRYT